MNYSKRMNRKIKRLIRTWILITIIVALTSSVITAKVLQSEDEPKELNFFIQKVQQPEPFPNHISLGEYRISAYCGCEKCCGSWANKRTNGIVKGSAGVQLIEGISVAAPLEIGTEIFIEGVGQYIVQDHLADWVLEKYDHQVIDIYFESHKAAEKYDHQVIDIYFESHKAAEKFGLQNRNVFIMKEVKSND